MSAVLSLVRSVMQNSYAELVFHVSGGLFKALTWMGISGSGYGALNMAVRYLRKRRGCGKRWAGAECTVGLPRHGAWPRLSLLIGSRMHEIALLPCGHRRRGTLLGTWQSWESGELKLAAVAQGASG